MLQSRLQGGPGLADKARTSRLHKNRHGLERVCFTRGGRDESERRVVHGWFAFRGTSMQVLAETEIPQGASAYSLKFR